MLLAAILLLIAPLVFPSPQSPQHKLNLFLLQLLQDLKNGGTGKISVNCPTLLNWHLLPPLHKEKEKEMKKTIVTKSNANEP